MKNALRIAMVQCVIFIVFFTCALTRLGEELDSGQKEAGFGKAESGKLNPEIEEGDEVGEQISREWGAGSEEKKGQRTQGEDQKSEGRQGGSLPYKGGKS